MASIHERGERMDVHLDRDSFLNQRTGEVSAPSEFLANLRALEESIARADEDIVSLKADLKAAKEAREKLVAQLRGCVREGRVLPLLELADDDAAAVDGPA